MAEDSSAANLEVTHAADVGMGSFYNHFKSKEQLFAAAVDEALDAGQPVSTPSADWCQVRVATWKREAGPSASSPLGGRQMPVSPVPCGYGITL